MEFEKEVVDRYGNCEVTVYKSHSKETVKVDECNACYDEVTKDFYIGIYA